MATQLPEVDAVLVGVGLVGTILGRELTRAGLKVVGLERGEPRFTVPDFQGPQMHDELRFSVRKALTQDNAKETVTFRNSVNDTALPVRRWGSFLPAADWAAPQFTGMDRLTGFRIRTFKCARASLSAMAGSSFLPTSPFRIGVSRRRTWNRISTASST